MKDYRNYTWKKGEISPEQIGIVVVEKEEELDHNTDQVRIFGKNVSYMQDGILEKKCFPETHSLKAIVDYLVKQGKVRVRHLNEVGVVELSRFEKMDCDVEYIYSHAVGNIDSLDPEILLENPDNYFYYTENEEYDEDGKIIGAILYLDENSPTLEGWESHEYYEGSEASFAEELLKQIDRVHASIGKKPDDDYAYSHYEKMAGRK